MTFKKNMTRRRKKQIGKDQHEERKLAVLEKE